MCIQNTLQQHILHITDNGKTVADFLHATMQGNTPNASAHHQLEAAKQLSILALQTTPSPSTGEGWDGGEETSPSSPSSMSIPVTDLDIINYDTARLIREETQDGYLIAEFLTRVMRGSDSQGNPFSPADRLKAAKELLNRGLGRFGDCRDRRISTSRQEELIHSGLSRYIRERTEQGMDAARFLLDVASGQDHSFTTHQRVVATRELIRRGWDTNYDAVTPERIAAYCERKEALEPTDCDIRLQQWRESERAEQEAREEWDEQPEEEPQLEAGLFAHLSYAELDRYEAMSAEEQQKFIQRQRQYRASLQSEKAHNGSEETSPPSMSAPITDPETIDWTALLQEAATPTSAPHPAHPVSTQTRIRSP